MPTAHARTVTLPPGAAVGETMIVSWALWPTFSAPVSQFGLSGKIISAPKRWWMRLREKRNCRAE
jgi:hypothetical protein